MKKLIFGILICCQLATFAAGDLKLLLVDTNDGSQYSSSITTTNGAVITATNSVASLAVQGVSTSAGAGDTGKVVKLNTSGLIDSTMISGSSGSLLISTNISTGTSGSSYVWTPICQITTTATNGNVLVTARATDFPVGSAVTFMRIRDTATNVVASVNGNIIGGGVTDCPTLLRASLPDSLSGTTKTYFMEVTSSTSSTIFTNTVTTSSQSPPILNGLGMTILQTP